MSDTKVTSSDGLIGFQGGPRGMAVIIAAGNEAKALPNMGRCRLVYIRALQANQKAVRLGGAAAVYTVPAVDRVWVNGDTVQQGAASGITLLAGEWFPFPIPAADLQSWFVVGSAPDGIEILAVG